MFLLIDANNIAYMSFHSLPEDNYDNKNGDIIGRFFEIVLTTAELYQSNQLFFFWDSKKSFRKLMSKSYKSNRKRDDSFECLYDAMEELQNITKSIGFGSFIQTGFEADDLIGKAVEDNRDETRIIISSDKDLWQLVNYNVDWYSPRTKEVMTHDDFVADWGLGPTWWARIKAIAGCSSDCVEGIKGVGEKTAAKYLRKELGEHTQAYQKIKENETLIESNIQYVVLPMRIIHGKKVITPKDIKLSEVKTFYPTELKDVFYEYQQNHHLGKKWQRWEGLFNGTW